MSDDIFEFIHELGVKAPVKRPEAHKEVVVPQPGQALLDTKLPTKKIIMRLRGKKIIR